MCMSMHIYVMYVFVYIGTCVCMYVSMKLCMYVYMYKSMYVCMYVVSDVNRHDLTYFYHYSTAEY
jgi:hypothetical protein